MKRLLRWLNPNTPLGGLAFGFVFGVASAVVILAVALLQSPAPLAELRDESVPYPMVLILGVFWAVIWCGSGVACIAIHGHLGTLATLTTIVGCTIWAARECGGIGWFPVIWLGCTFLAIIPGHVVWYIIGALIGRVRDPEEAR